MDSVLTKVDDQWPTLASGPPLNPHNLAQIPIHDHRAGDASPGRSALNVIGRGGGQPLPETLRADMEARMGADLSTVRVHADERAAEAAASVSAQAFTVGNEIVFGAGFYAPSTLAGKRRLAHELAHVVQQRAGTVTGVDQGEGVALSDSADVFEREAEAWAELAMRPSAPTSIDDSRHPDKRTEPSTSSAAPRMSMTPSGTPVLQRLVDADATPTTSTSTGPGSPWLTSTRVGDFLGRSDIGSSTSHEADAFDLAPRALIRELVPESDRPPQPSPDVSESRAETAGQPGEDMFAAIQRWEQATKKVASRSGDRGSAEAATEIGPEPTEDEAGASTGGADQPEAGIGDFSDASANPAAGPNGSGGEFGLPKMPDEIAHEFATVAAADREGQHVLEQAVDRTLAELHSSIGAESEKVEKDLEESTATITASVAASRKLVQGAAGSAKAHIAKGRKEQGDRIAKQLSSKKQHAHEEIVRIAGEVEGVAKRKADDAQKIGDDAAATEEGVRHNHERTVRDTVARKMQEAHSNEEEPELIQASLDGQRGAAKLVGSDTMDAVGLELDNAARDFRSGGPRIHAENAEKIKPLLQTVLDQEVPTVATLTTAADQASAGLDAAVTEANDKLQKAAQGVISSLTQTEKQSTKNLRTAAETTNDGLRQTERSAETELKARSAQFTASAHERLAQALESVSNRPMRRQLARTLSAELRSVLRHNYGMGAAQAAKVAGKIAGQLSTSLAQFHTELHESTAHAADVAGKSGHSSADQMYQLQRQVVAHLSSAASTALEGLDTSLTVNLERQAGIIGVVDVALAPLVDKTRQQVGDAEDHVLQDARAKIDSLDERIFEAMRKAREKAEYGAFGAWLADQLRSLGHALLTPSFWAGLLVGLLVTIFIVATFGGGLAVLVVAGAIAGALGAAASYTAQIYLDPLVNPNMAPQKFDPKELGKQMLIGGIFGAVGALGGGVVSKGLASEFAGTLAKTVIAEKVAQSVVGAGLGAVQNVVNGSDWDEGLVTNLAVSAVMSSKLVEEHVTGALGKGAREAMVDRGTAFRVEPGEFSAAQQRLEAKAAKASAPLIEPPHGGVVGKEAASAHDGAKGMPADAPGVPADPKASGVSSAGGAGVEPVPAISGTGAPELPAAAAKAPAEVPAPPEAGRATPPDPEVPEVSGVPRRPVEEPHAGGIPADHLAGPEEGKPVQPGDFKPESEGGVAKETPAGPAEEAKPAAPKNDEVAKGAGDPKAGEAIAESKPKEVNPHDPSTLLKADQPPAEPHEMDIQKETGTPVATQRKLIEIAEKHGVLLDVRPTNVEAPTRLVEGNLSKPEAIKAKSITPEDVHLGFREKDIGLVGYKMPEYPNLESIPASEHADVLKRYQERSDEYFQQGKEMSDLQLPPGERTMNHHGFDRTIQLDEHGVVRTPDLKLKTGEMAGFTGDHDVFMIRDLEGNQVTGKKYNEIVAELKSAGIGVEHGAHMNWKAGKLHEPGFRKIVGKHAIGPDLPVAKEQLVTFGGKETSRTSFDPGTRDPLERAHAAAREDEAAPNAPKEAPSQLAEAKPLFDPAEVDRAVEGIGPHEGQPPTEPQGAHTAAAPAETPGVAAPKLPEVPEAPRTPEARIPSEAATPVRKMVDGIHDEMPEHTVMMDATPKDPAGAHTMYENSRLESPGREVAIYRNSDTGEHIVIQGGQDSVSVGVGASGKAEAPSAGNHHQEWKEILDGQRVGRWDLIRHSHPADLVLPSGERVTPPKDRAPSGRGGDFSIAEADAKRSGRPVEQKIDIRTERGDEVVSFGYDPGQERPYHVTVPDHEGAPQTTRFKSLEAYGEWYEHQFGGTPNIEPDPPSSAGRGGAGGGQGEGSARPAAPGRTEPSHGQIQGAVVSEVELSSPSHLHVEEEPEHPSPAPELHERVAALRRSIIDSGRRPAMARAAAAELSALTDALASGRGLPETLAGLEDKYGKSLNLVQGETTPVTADDPEFQRIVSDLTDLDTGDAMSGRFADLWVRLYEEHGTLSMGRSVRSSAGGSLVDTYDMRRDFLRASLPEVAADPAALVRGMTATGGAIPAAVDIVRDHLLNALDRCGGAQGAVDAGLAIWVDRNTGRPIPAGAAGAVLWPSEPAGAWWTDHGVELRHGGPDDVTNYVPVPYGIHLAKSRIMGHASTAVAGRDND